MAATKLILSSTLPLCFINSDLFKIIRAAAAAVAAVAAAESLQSCPTLCDPIDGSPPGSAVPYYIKGGSHLVSILSPISFQNVCF